MRIDILIPKMINLYVRQSVQIGLKLEFQQIENLKSYKNE